MSGFVFTLLPLAVVAGGGGGGGGYQKSPSPKQMAKSPSPPKAKSPSPPKAKSPSPPPSCSQAISPIIPPQSSAGEIYCWGWNWVGQCGNGGYMDVTTPAKPSFLGSSLFGSTFTKVAAGRFHSGGITSDGLLYMWGRNDYGSIGVNFPSNQYFPAFVPMPKPVAFLALGGWHSGALTPTGRLFMWGFNGVGQVGFLPGLVGVQTTPAEVPLPCSLSFNLLSLGFFHSGALTPGGDIFMWGYNVFGQLGDGTTIDKYTPTLIKVGTQRFQSLSLGLYHTGAVSKGGQLYLWGANNAAQIGDGTVLTQRFTPTLVTVPGTLFQSISLSGDHSGALSTAGALFGWGANEYGQVGDGTTVTVISPTQVSIPGQIFNKFVLGNTFSTALANNGSLYTWGSNAYSMLGVPPTEVRFFRASPGIIATPPGRIISLAAGLAHGGIVVEPPVPLAALMFDGRRTALNGASVLEVPVTTLDAAPAAQTWTKWAPVFTLPATVLSIAALVIVKWRTARAPVPVLAETANTEEAAVIGSATSATAMDI